MKLPAAIIDVFFCVLAALVPLCLLLSVYANQAPEVTLPPVDLTQIEAVDGVGVTTEDLFIVTMAKGPSKTARILLSDKEVDSKSLEEAIEEANPREVCLRVDKEVDFGEVEEVMWLCVSMGVHRVSFAGERQRSPPR